MFEVLVICPARSDLPSALSELPSDCRITREEGFESLRGGTGSLSAHLLIADARNGLPLGVLADGIRGLAGRATDSPSAIALISPLPVPAEIRSLSLGSKRIELVGDPRDSELLESTLRGCVLRALELHRLKADGDRRMQEQEAKESLVQKLVHDMKSPLTVMLIELGMLERWWEKGNLERFQGGISRLTHNCEDLIGMIQNLLDASRLRRKSLQIKLTTIGLGAAIRETLDNPPALLEKRGIRLLRDLRETDTTVRMDAALMVRVMSNALQIAAKLSPRSGRIDFAAGRRGQSMQVRIESTAEGLDRELLPSLFDQYAHEQWRALGLDAGLGIGLNFSRLVVEAHGGRVSLESPEGSSLRFSIELPVAE